MPFMVAVLLAAFGPAAAQTATNPPTELDPKACAPDERLTHRDLGPGQKSPPDGALSDKLARTDGVLCPPRTDPEMSDKPPEGGAMKVIPPPGSPGNQPHVRPK